MMPWTLTIASVSDVFDMSSSRGRYEDSQSAVDRCLAELDAMEHKNLTDNLEVWLVNGVSIKQSVDDGFVRQVTDKRSMYTQFVL